MDADRNDLTKFPVPVLVEWLASDDGALPRIAQEALYQRDERVIEELAPYVNDPRAAVRLAVTHVIRVKGGLRSGPPLVQALQNAEKDLLVDAMEGLAELGDPAARLLQEKLEDISLLDEPAWKANIQHALAFLQAQARKDRIILEEHAHRHAPDLTPERDLGQDVRPATEFHPTPVLGFLQKPVRKRITWRPARTDQPLDSGLRANMEKERPPGAHHDQAVFDAMCAVPDMPSILRDLGQEDSRRRNQAIEQMHRIGRPAVQVLCGAVESRIIDGRVRRTDRLFLMAAMDALREIHSRNAIATLRRLAVSRGDEVVAQQARWLAEKLRR